MKVRATRPCTISKNTDEVAFNYTFQAGEEKEVTDIEADILLHTGLLEVVEGTVSKKETIEEDKE